MSRAFVVSAHGGPEVLQLTDRDVGEPGPGEIKIRHTAIGLNFIDTYQRSGLYPQQMPFVPGNEGSGVVLAIGEGVAGFAPGDRITYSSTVGAYAEERLLKADRAVPLPDGISDQIAAAMMLKGTTAYYLLHRTFKLDASHTILVHAAAGGVGQIATQWAKEIGARVIGTAGSEEKTALAKSLGCDEVINYTTEDFVERVKAFTDNTGVDVVYDGVGKATFEKSLDCLKPLGLMVSFGNASGPVSIPSLGILATKGSLYVTRPTTATYLSDPAEMRKASEALFSVVESGAVKIDINRTYPLADVAEAHRALESRQTTGSVVLIP